MKSPILQKAIDPLRKIDYQRDAAYRQQYATWKQTKTAGTSAPCPARPGRLLVQDATPEKIAEILSRDPAGALMVHGRLDRRVRQVRLWPVGAGFLSVMLEWWLLSKRSLGQGT